MNISGLRVGAWSLALALFSTTIYAQQNAEPPVIGMYVHQHWPYNHPYAARTWTLDDWRGYADGLHKLGFNSILIWPLVEIMPDPMTPTDVAAVEKTAKVIDMLHKEFGMRVYVVVCANIVAKDAVARDAVFEKRHYYWTERFLDQKTNRRLPI